MASIPGSCLCGAVRYEISPPYAAFQYCHCSRCRKGSGSAHVANLFVPADQLTWVSGREHAKRWELPDAKWWCNGFCDVCGCKAPWLTKNGRSWVVPAGTLDGDPGMKPERSVHWASRADWYVFVHDLERFDTYPGR